MANLIEVAEELEFVPKEQLAQMTQDPNSRYPSYMVLSEIQRRTQLERMYNAERAAQEKPTSTVAEELVAGFVQPKGLAGMGANGSAGADVFSPDQAMPASPMQMAASGGRTGFQNTGSTSRQNLLASLDINPYSQQRGVRNNNPLNIRYNPNNDWQGQLGVDSEGFAVFEDMDSGFRAAQQTLGTYGDDHGIDTISDVVSRWAPAKDRNDVAAYTDFVSSRTGINPDKKIDLSDPDIRNQLMMAQAGFETPDLFTGSQTLSQMNLSGRIDGRTRMPPSHRALRNANPRTINPIYQPYTASSQLTSSAAQGQGLNPFAGQDQTDPNTVFSAEEVSDWADDLGDWAEDRYLSEGEGLGSVRWGNVISDASWLIPGGMALRGAWLGAKGLKGLYQSGALANQARRAEKLVRPLYTKPRKVMRSQKGKEYPIGSSQGQMIKNIGGRSPVKSTNLRDISMTRIGGLGFLGAQGYKALTGDDDQKDVTPPKVEEQDAQPTTDEQIAAHMKSLGLSADSNKGLSGKVNSYIKQADGLDIAKLGGVIMGARNMSELGQGITALATDIQDRKTAQQAREDTMKLQGIQSELYQAQADKIQQEIEDMPYEQLVQEFSAVSDAYKELAQQVDSTELEQYVLYLNALRERMAKMRGINVTSTSPQGILNKQAV